MPSNIPSYVYSLFAALIVGTIIVSSISISMANIKNKAENQQLANIDEYVATQSLSLLTHAPRNQDQNESQLLEIPTQIGNQRFWVCIANDSSGAWVETGFGTTVNLSQPRFSIPAQVVASGIFVSGSGRAFLKCSYQNQTVILTLTSE
jgi:hypothetical protein